MADRAHVASLDAVEAFRTSLILYLERAGRALDEVGEEVTRTRFWLESDRRVYWEQQVRRRRFELERAQQELFSARLSTLQPSIVQQQVAVQRARKALAEAEEKLARVRLWIRQFDTRVELPAREVEKLRGMLSDQMVKAVQGLTRTVGTLADYAGRAPAGEPAPETTGAVPDTGEAVSGGEVP